MCVVGHGYGGMGGTEMEVVDVCRHAGLNQVGFGCMSGDFGALHECDVKTLMTPDSPPSRCAALGRVVHCVYIVCILFVCCSCCLITHIFSFPWTWRRKIKGLPSCRRRSELSREVVLNVSPSPYA